MTTENSGGEAISLRRRVFSIQTLLAFVVAIAFILFLATRFDVKWSETWDQVRGMDLRSYVTAVFLYYTSFWFRGVRWRILARDAGVLDTAGARLPSHFRFAQLIVIGWFVNSVTWLRMGDAYRAYAFSEESRVGFSWSLGTVFAERVLDMVTVLVLVLIGVASFTTTSDSNVSNYLVAAAFLMSVAMVALLVAMRRFGPKLARALPGRLGSAYIRFQKGSVRGFKRLPVLLTLSLIGWLLEVGRLYFVVVALDMDIGLPLLLLVALGHAILSTVPTPGGVGAVEPGVTGLLMLSFSRETAVAIALVDRSITYLSVIAFGAVAFFAWQASHARRHQYDPSDQAATTKEPV